MDAFKIENYERVHGLGTFVPFRHLTKEEAARVRESLRKCLELPEEIGPMVMVRAIHDRSTLLEGVNALSENFNLQQVLHLLNLDVSETVYLNWSCYGDVDEIKTRDLIMKFDDIWYPSVDDLDIIDSKMRWLVSIEHSGAITALSMATIPF